MSTTGAVDAPAADGASVGWMSPGPNVSYRRAIPWSVLAVGGQQGLTALLSFVLAVLVGPEAFGTIAMAMVYLVFIQLLVRQGLVQALVQRRELSPAHVDAAFWMILPASLLLGAASIAASGPWAAVNQLPELQAVIIGLSPLVLLQGLTVVQEALLRRRLEFRSLAIRTLLSVFAGGLVGLALAVAGAGVWALVVQQLTMAAVAVVVLWCASGWRPRLDFSTSHARELLGFSAGSALGSLANFASSRADALLVGLLLGPIAVGLYRLAARLTEVVTDVFTRSIQQVSLPELSRLQDHPEEFRARALEILRCTSAITIPMLGVLAGTSGPLFDLFGSEWTPAVLALQVLCLVTAVRSILLVNAAVLLAAGRPFVNAAQAWCSGVSSVVVFLLAGLAVRDAPIGRQVAAIALARLAAHLLVLLPTQLYAIHRVAGLGPVAVLRTAASATVAGGAAAAAGVVVLALAPIGGAPALLRLTAAGGVGVVAALVVLASLDRAVLVARLRPLRARVNVPVSDLLRGVNLRLVRWLPAASFVVAAISLTVAITHHVYQRLEPVYQASAALIVGGGAGSELPEDARRTGQATMEPFVAMGAGGTGHAAATDESLRGAILAGVAGPADDGDLQVELVRPPRSPIVEITASASRADASVRAVDELVRFAVTDLERRQRDLGAPEDMHLRLQVLRQSARAVGEHPPRLRIAAVVSALCLFASAAAWSLASSWCRRTHRTRARDRSAPPWVETTAPSSDWRND